MNCSALCRATTRLPNICWIFRHRKNHPPVRPAYALCKVASRGHLNIAKVLLDREAAAEHTESRFISPLHGAAFKEHTEFVRLLIECDVNEPLSFIFFGFSNSPSYLHHFDFLETRYHFRKITIYHL